MLIALVGLIPLCFEKRPVEFVSAYHTPFAQTATKVRFAVIADLLPAARAGTTTDIKLSAADREALEHGRVYLEVLPASGSMSRADLRMR